MPDELDKSTGERDAADEGESDRPTVSPPFDPAQYAREQHTHATPPAGTAQVQAALNMSRGSALPPERKTADLQEAPTPESRPTGPDSIRSLAAVKLPTNDVPRIDVPPKRPESFSAMNAVDREWADLEVATRPPPADAPHEDPVLEVSTEGVASVSLDLDDVDLGEHDTGVPKAVSEPPLDEKPSDHDDHDALAALDNLEVTPQVPPVIVSDKPEPLVPVPAPTPSPSAPVKPLTSTKPQGPPTEQEMNDRMSVGDYSGALEIAEKLLAEKASDSVRSVADNCRAVLKQMYSTRIGPLDRVPSVAVARDQLRWLSIDHKAGFVLSLVDGVSTLEMIIDVSGMPQLDTLRILSELVQQRIISLR